ncbi:caspase domain-containing protein [Mycena leptocephala]|nr:caspase domain-containing protein [Mycena leptocephala]
MGDASTEKHSGAIFALIIGINDYFKTNELHPLRGAVNDARAFEKYLLDLHVPPSNIVLLKNEKATRSVILTAFKTHLLDNTNIPDRGEATMIFFFAGHGSRFEAPSDLIAPDRRVEAICPVDERTTNEAGEYVHAIPDYVLVWLFAELADKKGTNIITIFDCCHSGASFVSPRSSLFPGLYYRRYGTGCRGDSGCSYCQFRLFHFWKGKTDTAQSHRMWSRRPHVMLVACLADETAREVQYDEIYHGRFTKQLVSLLEQTPLESATWAELLSRIEKWWGQTPYCGGTRHNRLIFNGNYPATGGRSVLLIPHESPRFKGASSLQLFRVEMGTVEGVVPETEFSAYDRNNSFLGTLFVQSVKVGQTILIWRPEEGQRSTEIPPWSRAVVSDWKNSPALVHTPAGFPYMSILFPTTGPMRPPNFVPAPSLEEAHIFVRCDGDELIIEPRTSTVLAGQRKPRFALGSLAHLPHAIDGVAHFNYFLDCANPKETERLEGVELQMHRLLGEYPFCGPDGNMIKDGKVQFTLKDGAKYGFTIRNTSNVDLFPYLFYFDLETYTIKSWYSPAGARVEPPLRNGGMVTIGMGSERAFDFTLSPGELSSCGFLKLFVTSDYIDLGWIQQELSPFDPRFVGTGRLRMSHEPLDLRTRSDAIWDVQMVTLKIAAQ